MKKIVIPLFLILALSTYFLIKHFSMSEEDRIQQTLTQAGRAIKERNIPKLLTYLSADYTDQLGNTKGTLFFFLRNIFNEYKTLSFHTTGLKIKVEGKEAKATFIVTIFTREKGEPIKNLIKERNRVLIKLRKEGNSWKIIRAEEATYTFD